MIILETTDLYLKTIEKEDTDILYEKIFSNEETMRSAFSTNALTLDETKKFLYKNFCKNHSNKGLAPLFEKSSGQLVGIAGVLETNQIEANSYTFSFVIIDQFRQKGYAKQIAKAQVLFAKKQLRQKYIFASVHKEDLISKNILLNLSFQYQKDINVKDNEIREIYTKKL